MCARAVSPVEVVEAHLRRVERLNPLLNAVITLAPDALEQARAAERAVARGEAPPLLGLPITIKDTIAVRGLRATSGSRARAEFVPREDAPAVARLRAAGAIIFGKTNTSEMAADYTAENPVFGRTNNPHDLTRVPGGSSGGCAAAVSAGLVPASLGSDLIGSIRIPAHLCGVAGLKPTPGSVPAGGHFPPTEGACSLAASLGPLARRVEDLELLYNALVTPAPAGARPAHLSAAGDQQTLDLGALRVAWYGDDGSTPVTEETRRALEAAAGSLRDAGLQVVEATPPHVGRATELWLALFARPVQGIMREAYAGREDEAGAVVSALLARGDAAGQSLDDYLRTWRERDLLRAELLAWMEERPLLVAPVGASHAWPHGARKISVAGEEVGLFRAFSYAQAFNVFSLPAVTVPAGRSREGLPVGVQVVGRPFAELEVLAAARVIEATLGGWRPPPVTLPSGAENPL